MEPEFSFEIAPEFEGEECAPETEWGRRSFPGRRPGAGFRRRPPAVRRSPPYPPGRPRPARFGPGHPWAIIPEPFPFEPASTAEPEGSERVRWIQDCLNQVLGLRLPVTGFMGPETRSAVRNFQRQRGLRATGIVGPDTEDALRKACGGSPVPAAEQEFGDLFGRIGSGIGSAFGQVVDVLGGASGSRIIDLTAKAEKSLRKGTRDPKSVYALVLHQMACCFKPKDPLKRFLKLNAHFAILADGRILQLHPVSALLWASHGFNARSVAVEFAGNFPNTKGKWWKGDTYGRNKPTPEQIEAGRYLVRHLIKTMGLTTILAHRQSSNMRENDPGPDIWYGVGQWAVDKLGLKDGGTGFKHGTGNPIPGEWRTWGTRPVTPEMSPALEAELSETELAHDAWPEAFEARSPGYVQWVQQSLNEVMGLQLPRDGVAGPVTRSALRAFQKRQGLPASGVVGPDTEEALREATWGGNGETPENEILELETLGPLTADLQWLPDNANPTLYPRKDAMKIAGGGVYIAVNRHGTPLKVGVTNSFGTRLGSYAKAAGKIGGVRFYLAQIKRGRIGGSGIAGADKAIEYAIARTLLRAGKTLPWHKLPKNVATVLGTVEIKNILPTPLASLVDKAFTAGPRDSRGQAIPSYPSPAATDPLRLLKSKHPEWEAWNAASGQP